MPPAGTQSVSPMSTRTRKLIGTLLLLATLGLYLPLAMVVGAARVTESSVWIQTLYFLVAGLIWVLPAGLLLRWMVSPDK